MRKKRRGWYLNANRLLFMSFAVKKGKSIKKRSGTNSKIIFFYRVDDNEQVLQVKVIL